MNESAKWAAENIHQWPSEVIAIGMPQYFEGDTARRRVDFREDHMWIQPSNEIVSHGEWQAARDELSGKPSWDDAPEWAKWLAQDQDGEWWWFEDKPELDSDCFACHWKNEDRASEGRVLGDWRNTLERRPKSVSTDTCKHASNDNCKTDCASCKFNQSRQWRGPEDGLPPVGTECEYLNHITQTVDYCTVVAEHDGGVVVAVHEDNLTYSYHHCAATNQFRPLPTEEDRAVEEMREIIVETYRNSSGSEPSELPHSDSLDVYLRKIYRAGYRKQESD